MPSQMQHSAGQIRCEGGSYEAEGSGRRRAMVAAILRQREAKARGQRIPEQKEGQLPVVPDGEVINMAIDERSAAATI